MPRQIEITVAFEMADDLPLENLRDITDALLDALIEHAGTNEVLTRLDGTDANGDELTWTDVPLRAGESDD